jgi:hypothetical protein
MTIKRFQDVIVGERFKFTNEGHNTTTVYTKTEPHKISKRDIDEDCVLGGDSGMVSEMTYQYLDRPHRAFCGSPNVLVKMVGKHQPLGNSNREWITVCRNAMTQNFNLFKKDPSNSTEAGLLGAIATYKEACLNYDAEGTNRKAWKA